MRELENIQAVEQLNIDMIGLIFWPGSPRCVNKEAPRMVTVSVDSMRNGKALNKKVARVGVFVDGMLENIVANVKSYGLQYVQLHGSESPTMIGNLRRMLDPGIRVIKALSIGSPADIAHYKEYGDLVDMFLFDTKCKSMGGSGKQFDWSVLDTYDGHTPFLLSGGIGPGDAARVKAFCHPHFAGIDLNSRFEKEPGIKDVEALRTFLAEVR